MFRLVAQLTHVSTSLIRFAAESRVIVIVIYYTILATMDIALFVVVKKDTDTGLRIFSLGCFMFAAMLVLATFGLFISADQLARSLLPNLNRLVNRQSVSNHLKIKLCSVKALIELDHVGVSFLDYSVFTPSKLFAMATNFVLNFFLVFNLYQTFKDYM